MRIHGFFDPEFDEPCVKVNVLMHGLGKMENIKFMIDTGSKDIIIFEGDATRRAEIDIDSLTEKESLEGAGGPFDGYTVRDVLLTFSTINGQQHNEPFDKIYIVKQSNDGHNEYVEDERLAMPGLLGRNFLHKYLMIYSRKDDTLIITDEKGLLTDKI